VAGTSIERRPIGGPDDHNGHGVVEPAHTGQMVSYNPDAPSEEWGWHGHWSDFAPRGRTMLLSTGVVGLLLMVLVGNHQSHVEDYFLVLIAALMVGWMVRTHLVKKRERRIRP